MKKASVIALILGILILLTSVILPVISVITSVTASANQGGIIGGASAPTFFILFSVACKGLPTVMAFTGLILIAASVVIRLIAKKKEI